MSDLRKIRRALISVSSKAGLVEFASKLSGFGIEIISTGGTARALREAGLAVTDVSDLTGFPEMMDGRVKTLHPLIHGAFLALRDNEEHVRAMRTHGIVPIDMIVVNLYPFEETISKEGVTLAEAIENIDIGGPAMIRSAAKNWRSVTVVTDLRLYETIARELEENDGSISLETRQRLALLAYARTASYDLSISSFLAAQLDDKELDLLEQFNPLEGLAFFKADDVLPADEAHDLPETIAFDAAKVVDLRYGENPHQKAALYRTTTHGGIANAEQLSGKDMSFNNFVDAEAAWNLVGDFEERAVAIIKHTNPSGVGVGATNEEAYRRALATDPVSAFGGIVALNRKVDRAAAVAINDVFTEVVIAPEYDADALEILRSKKNLRVLKMSQDERKGSQTEFKQISGGFLIQETDNHILSRNDLNIVTKRHPADHEIEAMLFAWKVCKHVRSNAIVFADQFQTLGVGAGQMNRVDSVRIAAMRAERFNKSLSGSALASDAFFPFRDNVDEAAKYGVSAIIQPGGSVRDEESIAAANEHGIAMAFTGIRHFKH